MRKDKYWKPERIWEGDDVFILGGGPSLNNVDLSLLFDYRVIGCNDAYLFGERLVDICYFCDYEWYIHHSKYFSIKNFTGLVVAGNSYFLDDPSIKSLQRRPVGLTVVPGRIAFFGSTGASAINLAIILGAKRIFLLGYDMQFGEKGKSNWHKERKIPRPNVYHDFLIWFNRLKVELSSKFKDIEVINLTEGSALKIFPFDTLENVLSKK